MTIIQELVRYKDLLKQLVIKDLKLKYRRSFLGYLWSILNPLGIMLIMTIVFSNMFRADVQYYPVYLIIGQTMYNYMSNSTSMSIYSILQNGPLLKKVYVPKYIFTVARVTSGLVDFVLSLAAVVLVMIITGVPFSWHMIAVPFSILQLYVFCMGVGLFLAQAAVFFRDIQYIYSVILTAWMYLTPIFYTTSILPEPLGWCVTHLNPLYFYVQQCREIVLLQLWPSPMMTLGGCVAAIGTLMIGLVCFRKTQSKFILYI